MANELRCTAGKTGRTIYYTITNNAGMIYDGTSFVTFNTINYTTYVGNMVEQGSTGLYFANTPSNLPSGHYLVIFRESIGGVYHMDDSWMGVQQLSWDGTTRVDLNEIPDRILRRNLGTGSDGGRTVQDALRASRNKVAIDVPSVGQLTVYQEDDVTPAYVANYTRSTSDLGAISGVDPV